MSRRAHARHTGAGAGSASATGTRGTAAHAPRRRARSLTRGDRAALGLGVALAALMLARFGWTLAQTVARDRTVAPGVAPAPAMPGH